MLNSFGKASSVFLALYAILFIWLFFGYMTQRFALKSRWTLLLFHVSIRLAAQSVGLAFAIKGYSDIGLLVASLVLQAEGYFSLMMCLVRLLISWQRHYTPEKHSWIAGKKNAAQSSVSKRILLGLTIGGVGSSPINTIHWLLIIANVLIVTGGSILAGGVNNAKDISEEANDTITTSKALRATGQGIFLCMTIFILGCVYHSLYRSSNRNASQLEQQSRSILIIMACTTPFMLTRGIFGLLQSIVNSLNYYSPTIYGPLGFRNEFVIKEVCCATMCEWITCTLLLSTSLLGMTKKRINEESSKYNKELEAISDVKD